MEKLKDKKILIVYVSLFATLIIITGYLFTAYYYSSTISSGTTIAKIDLSGKKEKEAVKLLEDKLTPQLKTPLVIKLKEKSNSILPSELAVIPDYKNTVKKITGFTLNPVTLYERIKGNPNAELIIKKTNSKDNEKAIKKLQEELGKVVINAGIKYEGITPVLTKAAKGEGFDLEKFYSSLSKMWFTGKEIILSEKVLKPQIDDKKAQKILEEVAKPLVSSSMFLKIDGAKAEINSTLLAESAQFVEKNGALVLKIDGENIREKIFEQLGDKVSRGQDAKIIIENNAPKIIPSVKGKNVDADKLAQNIVDKATKNTDREFSMKVLEINPELTTEEADKLGVKEIISEYTIPIKGEAKRQNLVVGSEKLNNLLVKPGDTFSYNENISPVTAANGYVPGLAIVGASYGWTYGGGLCQLATTVYNAAFFGGMKEIEHKPHNEYFSDYPVGRDSAYWEGLLDLKFENDTPYGVVIQSYVDGWDLHVKLWSTKYFEVKSETGQRYANIPFKTRKVDGSNCVGNSVGSNGFSIDVWRARYLNGKEYDSQTYTSNYKPSDIVKCTKDDKPENEDIDREEIQFAPDQEQPVGQSCGISGCR